MHNYTGGICMQALPRIFRFFFNTTAPPPPKKNSFYLLLKKATKKIPKSKISNPQNILRSSLEIRSKHWSCIIWCIFTLCAAKLQHQQSHKYFWISLRSGILIFSFDLKMAIYYSYVRVTSYMKVNTNSNRSFARWHHFTTTTRILQRFAILC